MLHRDVIANLKSVDPDRYRTASFAKTEVRENLYILYAFHAELAKVPELVSEPMIGEIRYHWWRDVIDEIFCAKPIRQHEITLPLATLVNDRKLSRFHLDRLIDGRARDLDPEPFADMGAAIEYCRATSGELIRLAVQCVSDDFDDGALIQAGEAWGLTGLARAWRYYQSSMLSNLAFEDICTAAQNSYDDAAKMLNPVAPDLVPAIGYVSLTPHFLSRMRKSGFDPAKDDPGFSPLAKQIQLMRAVVTGRL